VSHGLEATTVSTEAGLFPGFTLGAAVAVDTIRVIAFQTKAAWRHAGNGRQDVKFLAGQLAVVIVVAVLLVGALAQQEVIIAQLELLQAIEVVARDALEIETIDALSVLVSLHGLGSSRARYLGAHNRLEIGGL
jgi:hypothetical protein